IFKCDWSSDVCSSDLHELDRFRIVQLSDVHHGPFTAGDQIHRAVEVANSLDPDLIALTGDYVSHERAYAAPCAEMLGRLRARHRSEERRVGKAGGCGG